MTLYVKRNSVSEYLGNHYFTATGQKGPLSHRNRVRCALRQTPASSVYRKDLIYHPQFKGDHAVRHELQKLVAKIMVSVFEKLFKKQVPIEVDVKICENWGENEGVL
jgi:hypothetical protein